ncbi:MAG: cytochrome c [Desulfuromonadales bacterium]|nr:cytochrome c [Desulfuromonadales bacterium]MBN2791362.1 cytochrome c [Desulfuromonadales bacterium]
MKKRDILLLAGALAIIVFLWMAPEESTKPVPKDEIHLKFYDMVKTDGKKAAEKFCEECHNADNVPFPEDHPSKFRCLFCHKIKP